MATLVFEVVPAIHTLIVCQEAANPTDREWQAYLVAVDEALKLPRPHRGLVITDGGHPNRAQQSQLLATLAGREVRTAIVSSATVLRFIVSVLALKNPDVKSFSPVVIGQAFCHLGLEPREYLVAQTVVARLQHRLRQRAKVA